MRANVGDRIVIEGHRIGEPDRDCEVLEVRGTDDGPVERWTCRLCDTTACGRLQDRCPVAGAHPPSWEHR